MRCRALCIGYSGELPSLPLEPPRSSLKPPRSSLKPPRSSLEFPHRGPDVQAQEVLGRRCDEPLRVVGGRCNKGSVFRGFFPMQSCDYNDRTDLLRRKFPVCS
jgi:hypothetical protein